MKVTGNVKYIPAGTTQYVVDGNDGQINVDTSVSAVTIILPNIINSGYANTDKGFIINDISNNAATNNITIVASNNTTNSQSSVLISVNGGTAKCSIASLNEWFVITEPTTSGMSGNLTANYIPKAVTSSTLGNSVIYQNGSNIGINTTNPLTKLTVSANDQSSLISSVRYENVGSRPAGIVSLRARGTDLLPTALVTGDEIATFAAVGYYGAGFGTTGDANFIFYAAENFTLTNRGTSCKVGTTPLGTSSVVYNFGINSEGNVSIGIPSLNPTARVQIKGVNATATNYALKVDNSASSPLLYVRNDGNVGVGTATPTSKLDVNGQVVAGLGGGIVTSNNSPFYAVRLNTGNPNYYSGFQYVFEVGGGVWGIGMSYVNNEFQFLTNGGSTAKFVYGDGNSASPNSKFVMDLNGGFFGANIASPTANIHAKGINSTSSHYALKVDNSTPSPLFYIRNDGLLSAPSMPTSNAGLTTGDMYVDTAANILANGDKVVGWKV